MDLNEAVADIVKNADIEGMQRCIEYSLQPKKVLYAMFETKRYECLPLFADALFSQYNEYDPIALDIYVELVGKDEVNRQIRFPRKRKGRILDRAVEREVIVNFNLYHPGTDELIFDKEDRISYYRKIMLSDCIDLFLIYKEDILSLYDEEHFCIHGNRFPQILKELCVTEELCKKFLRTACLAEPGKHDEELLLHIYKNYDCRDDVYFYLFASPRAVSARFEMLTKVAARFDARIIPKLAEVNPKLCAKYFPEDV